MKFPLPGGIGLSSFYTGINVPANPTTGVTDTATVPPLYSKITPEQVKIFFIMLNKILNFIQEMFY